METDWSRYFHHQPPVEFESSTNLYNELRSSSARLEDHSQEDTLCNIWTQMEQPRVRSCDNRSFVMDARIRLDNLKTGCNSPQLSPGTEGILYNYNSWKDVWKKEKPADGQSALDSVELLDMEEDEEDEESWLYESPKKQEPEGRTESALTWCRRVLDNHSPEVEAACRQLMNRLDERSSFHSYRCPAVFHHPAGDSLDKTPVSTAQKTSDGLDKCELSMLSDFTATSYRLHNITDVHNLARLQEASLRQDFVSTPAAASQRRGPESPLMSPSPFNKAGEETDDFTTGCNTATSSSSCRQPSQTSLSSSTFPSPSPGAQQGCQSPRMARLQQQVTQFKLLKLAQNQATSVSRSASPLRTSLRSLQAVRNSRSLDTEECQPADQIHDPPSGTASVSKGTSGCSPSRPRAPVHSGGPVHSGLDLTARIKKLQRSQSCSPCRIPHSARGYLSFGGRVFASPERTASLAWGRNLVTTRR